MKLGKKIEKRELHGDTFYLRTLNGGKDAAEIIDMLQQVSGKPSLITEVGARLVVACVCDEHGNAVYSDVEHIKQDANISFLTAFVEMALDFSGLNDDAEEVKKNLQAVQ